MSEVRQADEEISDTNGDDSEQGEERFRARIRWTEPDDSLAITFVNAIVSQWTPAGEFIVTFGQLVPPNTAGLTRDEIHQIQTINVTPVARIGLAESRMRELLEILQRNYAAFIASAAKEQKEG